MERFLQLGVLALLVTALLLAGCAPEEEPEPVDPIEDPGEPPGEPEGGDPIDDPEDPPEPDDFEPVP